MLVSKPWGWLAVHRGWRPKENGRPGTPLRYQGNRGSCYALGVRFRPAQNNPAETGWIGMLDGLEVLIFEDSDDTRDALELLLAGHGLRVRSAGSVEQALAAYGKQLPDLLISDIGRGEDGHALIRASRKAEEGSGRRMHALAVSGFARDQDVKMSLEAGFDEHLPKPIDIDHLVDRIRVLVGRSG